MYNSYWNYLKMLTTILPYKGLFCIIVLVNCLVNASSLTTRYSLHIPADDGICVNSSRIEQVNGDCKKLGKELHCFGGVTNKHLISINKTKKIEEVLFCSWQETTFDPPVVLKHFPKLRDLRIEHSNLTYIYNDFPDTNYLERINISWTKLSSVRPTLFKEIRNLKYLDLRWNKLIHIDGPLQLSKSIQQMFLAGNPWNCTRNLKWLVNYEKSQHIVDRETLQCMDRKYLGKHLLTVMHYKLILKYECLSHPEIRNCSCSMHYIRKMEDGKSLTPIYAVNCSHLHLYNFPSYLPENTTIFYGTDNHISDVRALRNNVVYRTVTDVYLDYNQIQSIDVLEAGYWLRHFRVLSLKGNKLTKLPVYALDNALENNHNAAKLQLSQNPWLCLCKFTMRFREILMKYHMIIKDSAEVYCKYMEGDNKIYAQVLSLNRGDVCKLPTEFKVQSLDLVNGILASLIVFILGKLGYDYYHYRRSGRLPWIVTKLP